MRKGMIISTISGAAVIVLILVGITYHHLGRFNSHITINRVNVGGLTAEQALGKLEASVVKNVVYIDQKQILNGKDTKMGFSDADLPEIQKALQEQRTLFPSSKDQNFTLIPKNATAAGVQATEQQLKETLLALNQHLKAPKDAEARLIQGAIVVSKSVNGNQYDVSKMLQDYQKQAYDSEIHLKPVYAVPIKADSPVVKSEEKRLNDLLQQTVSYKLQNTSYDFKGSEVIQNASVAKNMTYLIDKEGILNKLVQINRDEETLTKAYSFKTHSGSVVSVQGGTYGWAIDVGAETKRIEAAFEKGQSSIAAYNIYGVGWNTNGVGYHTTTNNGIGTTYVEVSIEQQRIWVYKNGNLMLTSPVVTGTHIYHEDTPKGIYYIMYKQSPATLKGSEVGKSNYSVKVSYWAPFTNSGDGLHDASWRSNWSSTAYLTQGSGGCVNIPPNIMKSVYDNVVQYEPVVIY